MKATEINFSKDSYHMSCKTYPARSHYKFLMQMGRVWPTTAAQARNFTHLDVLNADDVEVVEALMNKHGHKGEYTYTKSKQWVRINNDYALRAALKAEYSL